MNWAYRNFFEFFWGREHFLNWESNSDFESPATAAVPPDVICRYRQIRLVYRRSPQCNFTPYLRRFFGSESGLNRKKIAKNVSKMYLSGSNVYLSTSKYLFSLVFPSIWKPTFSLFSTFGLGTLAYHLSQANYFQGFFLLRILVEKIIFLATKNLVPKKIFRPKR